MKANELKIAEPCKVDWTKMTPAEGGRFCADCKKVVKNLSSMTEREARKLLRSANDGQLCVRFLYDKHGKVFFGADAPRPDFVPASMLSRAKRALAVAGLAAASQACSAMSDVTNAFDSTSQAEEQDPDLRPSMGGVAIDPSSDVWLEDDAGGGASNDAAAADGGAGDASPTDPPADQDAGPSSVPN